LGFNQSVVNIRCQEGIVPSTSCTSLSGAGMVKDLKVLIVDDSVLARKMLARLLAGMCSECHHADNGQEAVQMVTETLLVVTDGDIDIEQPRAPPYDVILMDYYMPVMNGPEAVRRIRSAGYQGVILAVTGSTSSEEQGELEACGVDRILTKPFSVEVFRAAMAEFREKEGGEGPVKQ
jgi:CheY-like chemotaxis protein